MKRLALRVLLAAAFVSPVGAGLFRVWVHQSAVKLGYELSAEERRGRELSELARQLEVELAAELSPARLQKLAAERGLAAPTPRQLLGRTATKKQLQARAASGGHDG